MTTASSVSRRACSAFIALAAAGACLLPASIARASSPFTLFESGQVRPLALSPDKKLLFAVNTPDNRLEVYQVKNGGLNHRCSVPVGLEPVAVAVRSSAEVWVVNHLSDSVSVVALDDDGASGHVARTLLVGDEPRDIVFAGPGKSRAFITTAHRGQNIPFDPQLTTPGVGRADVWVFDAQNLGASLGGSPINIVTLFSDTPRALAVTPDGSRVYAAAFHSGNRTTIVSEQFVTDGFGAADGALGPATNFEGTPATEVGLIVKWDGAHWRDGANRIWDDGVKFHLPDKDVFAIDAMSNPPAQVAGPSGVWAGVGTILFNMVVNPVNGKVYVSNTDAQNMDRFEGAGIFTGHSLRGHLHESRITVLGPGTVSPRHLNKHINYGACCAPTPNAESEKSLAQPTGMAITSNGATLYVAALGSSKVGVFSTAAIENNTFTPSAANQIQVSGGGPTGLVLNEPSSRLYVLTRFDNAVSIVNTATKTEVGKVFMHSPEPPSVVNGRRFLYDARTSSSHGDSSCGSCHIFGDFDSLAWDLGNPDKSSMNNPGPFINGPTNLFTGLPADPTFNALKGPMVTQSLRGMANHGPMHWRGDRTGGNDAPTAEPDSGTFNERAAFEKFQGAFPDLLGRSASIPPADMQAFTDFILQVTYPPNPIRNLDNSLTPAQQAGRDFYFNTISDATSTCNDCHTLDPTANPGSAAPGFFGTSAGSSWDFESAVFKVPHMRNLYQKIGMFGMPAVASNPFDEHPFTGDQVRGYGFTHDGSFDTNLRFLSTLSFTPALPGNVGIPLTPEGDALRRGLESFLLAFDTNLAPIVGQQITLSLGNALIAGPRIDLLMSRADAGECDLVAKAAILGQEQGFSYIGANHFLRNRQALPPISGPALKLWALLGVDVTYTCVPPGSGIRVGIDRDEDGFLDGDERDAGSDPADPSSTP